MVKNARLARYKHVICQKGSDVNFRKRRKAEQVFIHASPEASLVGISIRGYCSAEAEMRDHLMTEDWKSRVNQ